MGDYETSELQGGGVKALRVYPGGETGSVSFHFKKVETSFFVSRDFGYTGWTYICTVEGRMYLVPSANEMLRMMLRDLQFTELEDLLAAA